MHWLPHVFNADYNFRARRQAEVCVRSLSLPGWKDAKLEKHFVVRVARVEITAPKRTGRKRDLTCQRHVEKRKSN